MAYYLARAEPIPISVASIAGDAIQNLRSALDHLVQQLWIVNNPGHGSFRDISFPTDSNAQQFKSSFMGKVKGLRQDAIDILRAIEPYDGGKGQTLSVLNRMNRIDKHRMLLTTYTRASVNLGAFMSQTMRESFPGRAFKTINLYAAEIGPPLKTGDKLLVTNPDAEPNKEVDFRLVIAFNEPGVVEGKPVIETIQHFSDIVSGVIDAFRPCLS